MPILASLRKVTEVPLDVHLMISEPAKYVDAFIEAGADSITFHIEAKSDPTSLLKRIREAGGNGRLGDQSQNGLVAAF